MKPGWYWDRTGMMGKGRYFIRNENHDPSALSIIRRKNGWYVIDDDKEDGDTPQCPVLGGPFARIAAAKVAYLLHTNEDKDFDW